MSPPAPASDRTRGASREAAEGEGHGNRLAPQRWLGNHRVAGSHCAVGHDHLAEGFDVLRNLKLRQHDGGGNEVYDRSVATLQILEHQSAQTIVSQRVSGRSHC